MSNNNSLQVNNKVLGLNAVTVIKDHIVENFESKLSALHDAITDEQRAILLGKLEEIWDKFEETSTEDKNQILDEISKLYEDQSDMQEAIEGIKNSIKDLEKGDEEIAGSVLTNDDVKDLILAALVDDTFFTDEMIGSPTIMGNNIIGVVGKFGTIKAANIKGDKIEGQTVQSFTKTSLVEGTTFEQYTEEGEKLEDPGVSDGTTTGPTWQLRKAGDGYLAGGRISWDTDGKVELKDVKIQWKDIDNPEIELPEDFNDGISVFTSTVFIRQNDTPDTPEGGSFSDPLPRTTIENGIIWEDGIPSGEEKLWASTRVFASDETSELQQDSWSEPAQMTDTSNFNVEFSSVEVDPGTPETYSDNWSNESNENTIWMATRTCSNGDWSDWNISKIKGEKGADGKSVNISRPFDTVEDLIDFYLLPENGKDGEPINKDSAHIIKNGPFVEGSTSEYAWNNHLFVWIGTNLDDDSLTDDNSYYFGWYDTGQFNGADGKDGQSAFVHIKYAKHIEFNEDGTVDGSKCIPTENGESTTDAKWIGICNTTSIENPTGKDPEIVEGTEYYDVNNWSKYNWSEFITSEDVEKRVTTVLGTYHISSDHIAGKTIDTSVEIDGEQASGYVELIDGTPYRIFEMTDGQESGYKDYIAGEEDENNSMGPAWQLRTNGAGYLAKGNIRWDENGSVEFGKNVKLSWGDNIDDDSKPIIPSQNDIEGWATTITNNSLSTFTIDASKITGDTISGKTIQSSETTDGEPNWKIDKEGAGYLANGKISWGTDGVLNAEINGSFNGGNEGSVGSEDNNGEYPMTWDENHIYINRNLVLGNDVRIDWEKVNSPEDLATTDFVSTQITNNKVTSENIEGTYIKGKTIKSSETLDGTETGDPTWIINNDGSGWLASKKIKFNTTGNILEIDGNAIMDGIENDAKDRFDTLIADKIEAIDITTDTLSTTGNVDGNGTIYIADNDMVVYNNDSPKEVLRISGQDYGDLPENITVGSKSISINSVNANNKSIVLANDSNLKSGYTYKLYTSASSTDSSPTDLPIKIFVKVKNNGSTKDKISVTLNSVYVSCNGQIYANKSIHNATKQLEVSNGNTTTFEFGISGDSYYKTLNIPKEFVGEGKPLEILIGQVTCYNATTYESTNYNIDSVGFSYADSTSDATYKPTLDRVDISATGFRKIIDPDRYFIIKPDNTFEVKYGSNIFGVDANGIYVKVPNQNNSMTQGYLEVNSSGQLILKS